MTIGPIMHRIDGDTRIRTDLTHLPVEKQQELELLVEAIRDVDDVEMIILYGSYARGTYKEEKDLKPKRWSGHASDYDLLIVVESPAQAADANLRHAFREACKLPGLSARAEPIVHDIADVNKNLEEARYFFLDLKREGRLLYNSKRFELAEPRHLTPTERQRIAQRDFDRWFEQASDFYDTYLMHFEKKRLRLAAFDLNQATESAYKCILLVFTGYVPHEHLLEWLGERAELFGPVYHDIFPRRTRRERERFELLDQAYIGARYRDDFIVHLGDIDYLAPLVKRLLDTTAALCRLEIEAIGQGAT
ncbi:HEPN domain-containing protein [Alkalilimnicola ehrlichii]|nr:HEPN domain-containing protein [Alkalilimnicola ehrlichii]